MIKHINIISESRSGSSWLFSDYRKKLNLSEEYSFLSECFDLDKNPDFENKFNFIIDSDKKLVIKNHLHQIRCLTPKQKALFDSIPSYRICIMRRNKLDQALSLALSRQTRNWNLQSDAVTIEPDVWQRAKTDILTRFEDILEYSETCDEVIWYEDLFFTDNKKINPPKNQTIKNLNELIREFYS